MNLNFGLGLNRKEKGNREMLSGTNPYDFEIRKTKKDTSEVCVVSQQAVSRSSRNFKTDNEVKALR